MKALVRTGKEAGAMGLREMPEPALEPGKVLLRVAACGICGTDIRIRAEAQPNNRRIPYIIGHEFAGIVEAVGEGVTQFQPGEAVASEPFGHWCGRCEMCRTGRVNNCREHDDVGFGLNGAFAPFIAVPARGVHRLPPAVNVQDAAILEPLAAAYNVVFNEGRIRAGNLVAVLGCGPIGMLCAAQALAGGAEVVITGWKGDDFRLEKARALGVQHAINSAETDPVQYVCGMAASDAPHLIVDAAGGARTFEQAIDMAPMCGTIAKIGWFEKQSPANMDSIVGKNLRIRGVYGQTHDAWEQSIRLLASGRIKLDAILTARFPLDEWERGYDLMAERKAVKVLLLPKA